MNRPGFLCIGAHKAGTKWLSRALREHPDVWLGPLEEYHYFNALFGQEPPAARRQIKATVERAIREHVASAKIADFGYVDYLAKAGDTGAMFTEDWYRRIFSRGERRIKGDVTAEYCTISRAGIDYAMRLLGSAPVIYLVRDPMERALSELRALKRAKTGRSLAKRSEWVALVNDPAFQLRGDYKTNITNWLARYPNQRLLFLPHKELVTQPIGALRKIEKHIGVSANASYPKPGVRAVEDETAELPEFVRNLLREHVSTQREYLASELGGDFAARA